MPTRRARGRAISQLRAQGTKIIYERVCPRCGQTKFDALASHFDPPPALGRRLQRAVQSMPDYVCSTCPAEYAKWQRQIEKLTTRDT